MKPPDKKNQTKAGARPGDPTSPRDSHRTRGKITKTNIYIYIYTNCIISQKLNAFSVQIHWTSDNPLENTTDKWSSVGKYHWTSIGKCHWKSTMISEVSISAVQSFVPTRPNNVRPFSCSRFQSLDFDQIDLSIAFQTSRDHLLIQDSSRLDRNGRNLE